jgi:hypothetical protein
MKYNFEQSEINPFVSKVKTDIVYAKDRDQNYTSSLFQLQIQIHNIFPHFVL